MVTRIGQRQFIGPGANQVALPELEIGPSLNLNLRRDWLNFNRYRSSRQYEPGSGDGYGQKHRDGDVQPPEFVGEAYLFLDLGRKVDGDYGFRGRGFRGYGIS